MSRKCKIFVSQKAEMFSQIINNNTKNQYNVIDFTPILCYNVKNWYVKMYWVKLKAGCEFL